MSTDVCWEAVLGTLDQLASDDLAPIGTRTWDEYLANHVYVVGDLIGWDAFDIPGAYGDIPSSDLAGVASDNGLFAIIRSDGDPLYVDGSDEYYYGVIDLSDPAGTLVVLAENGPVYDRTGDHVKVDTLVDGADAWACLVCAEKVLTLLALTPAGSAVYVDGTPYVGPWDFSSGHDPTHSSQLSGVVSLDSLQAFVRKDSYAFCYEDGTNDGWVDLQNPSENYECVYGDVDQKIEANGFVCGDTSCVQFWTAHRGQNEIEP